MSNVPATFRYLNRLRESGVTNMYGAAPYIQEEFAVSRAKAKSILMEWMQWVSANPSNRDL